MIVKVADYLASIGGKIDDDHYFRSLPDRPGWAAVCQKPRYGKKRRKKMAERDTVKDFARRNQLAAAIYNDPVQRAEWAAKHAAARREASRHPKGRKKDGKTAVPVRLWDYIKKEVGNR